MDTKERACLALSRLYCAVNVILFVFPPHDLRSYEKVMKTMKTKPAVSHFPAVFLPAVIQVTEKYAMIVNTNKVSEAGTK